MAAVFGVLFNALILFAWGFLFWGAVKYNHAHKPENAKNYDFQVRTFWVLFFGSALWLAVGVINVFVGESFWAEGIFAFCFGHAAYALNKTIRTLPAPPGSI